MGKNCVIVGCRNKDTNKIEGLKFHRIPKDEPRRSLWLKAINRICPVSGKPWVPSDDGRICSSHFVKEKSDNPNSIDYIPSLKLNSVPTAQPTPERRKFQFILPKKDSLSSEEECSLRWNRWQKFLQSITHFLKTTNHLSNLSKSEIEIVETWAPNFYIEDGILRQQAKSSLRRFIPITSYVDCVQHISDCHITMETTESGQRMHSSFEQTLHKAVKKHVWPGAEEDVYDFLKICLTCKGLEVLKGKQSLISDCEQSFKVNLPECFRDFKKDRHLFSNVKPPLGSNATTTTTTTASTGLKSTPPNNNSNNSSNNNNKDANNKTKKQTLNVTLHEALASQYKKQNQASTVINLKIMKPSMTSSSPSSSASSQQHERSSLSTAMTSSSSSQMTSTMIMNLKNKKKPAMSLAAAYKIAEDQQKMLQLQQKQQQKIQQQQLDDIKMKVNAYLGTSGLYPSFANVHNTTNLQENQIQNSMDLQRHQLKPQQQQQQHQQLQKLQLASSFSLQQNDNNNNNNGGNNNNDDNNSNTIKDNILSGKYLSSDVLWLSNFQNFRPPQRMAAMSNFHTLVACTVDGMGAPAGGAGVAMGNMDGNQKKSKLKMRPVFEMLHDIGFSLVKESVYKDLVYSVELAYPPYYVDNNIGKARPVEIAQALDGWKKTRYTLGKANKHLKSPWIVCSRCVFLATSLYQLSNHQKYGHSYLIGRYDCCLCKFSTKTNLAFQQHMIAVHNVNPNYYAPTTAPSNNNNNAATNANHSNSNNNASCMQQQYQHLPLISGINGMYVCQLCPYMTKISAKVTFKNHLECCSRTFKLCTNLFPVARDADIPMMWPTASGSNAGSTGPGKRKRMECVYLKSKQMMKVLEDGDCESTPKQQQPQQQKFTTILQQQQQQQQQHHPTQQQQQQQNDLIPNDKRVEKSTTVLDSKLLHPSFYHHVCELCCAMLRSGASLEQHLTTIHNIHLPPGLFDLSPFIVPPSSSPLTLTSSSYSSSTAIASAAAAATITTTATTTTMMMMIVKPFYKCCGCDDYFYSARGLMLHRAFVRHGGGNDGGDVYGDGIDGEGGDAGDDGGVVKVNGGDGNDEDESPLKKMKYGDSDEQGKEVAKSTDGLTLISSSPPPTTVAATSTTPTTNPSKPAPPSPSTTTTVCPLCRRTRLQDVVAHLSTHHRILLSDMFTFKFCSICMVECHSNRSFECHMLNEHRDLFANRYALYKAVICSGYNNSCSGTPSGSGIAGVAASVVNGNVSGNFATDDVSNAISAFNQFFSTDSKQMKSSATARQSAVLSALIQDKLKDGRSKRKFSRSSFGVGSKSLSSLFCCNSGTVECPVCSCQFPDSIKLSGHFQLHHRERCSQCKARFGSRKHLVRHIKQNHTDRTTGQCKVCKLMIIKENDDVHLMEHVCFKNNFDDKHNDDDDSKDGEHQHLLLPGSNGNNGDGGFIGDDDVVVSKDGSAIKCNDASDEVLIEISNWKPNSLVRVGVGGLPTPQKFESGNVHNDIDLRSKNKNKFNKNDDDDDDDNGGDDDDDDDVEPLKKIMKPDV